MEENFFLVGALENILGKSKKTARGNRSFHCPFCNHRKPKLEIKVVDSPDGSYPWQCWVCGTKGRTIQSLLRHLNLSGPEAREILQYVRKSGDQEEKQVVAKALRLPEEFEPLELASKTSVYANRVRSYLYGRGLTETDFIRYGIGYCVTGKYEDHIIVPSYSENNVLNYFVARNINPGAYRHYTNPEAKKDEIICFENLINFDKPLILCEGVFDAMSLRRNAAPLLGQNISSALMKRIITSSCPDIYICLDRDAQKRALNHCETFLNMGKRVFFVVPPKKDSSETGFELMTRVLQTAEELTFSSLIEYKLNLI